MQETGYRSIMVVIPPEMADCDERCTEIIEYVAACVGFDHMHNDLQQANSVSCEAHFQDDKGNIWHGQLYDPPFPDGSQKYMVDIEKKAER